MFRLVRISCSLNGSPQESHCYDDRLLAITTAISRLTRFAHIANGFIGLALGLTHGLAPGHGWAIAASYALDKPSKWFYGATSSLILGIGHLISSIAMVVVYFWAISYFGLTQIGWMNYVAGALLIALGIWQYFNGHSHTGDDSKKHPSSRSRPHKPSTQPRG